MRLKPRLPDPPAPGKSPPIDRLAAGMKIATRTRARGLYVCRNGVGFSSEKYFSPGG